MSDHANEVVTEKEISTKEFLAKVEEAARNGAMQGSKGGRRGISLFELLKTLILIAVLATVGFMVFRFQGVTGSLKGLVARNTPVEDHDLTLENNGFLGYTVADFQEAILGDSEQLKKLEVYKIDVSDAVQLTDTGLAKLKIFTKTQLLTYKGTATYTVDLGKLSKDDITLDEEKMTVHLKVPEVVLEPINIDEKDIEFGDVERGLLGIGRMSMKPEDMAKIQEEARNKMTEKLEEQKSSEVAERFAKMSVWEIYQPIVDTVTSGYSLDVEIE